jgi:cephalosporin-C deacetylase-like acetyl esterase
MKLAIHGYDVDLSNFPTEQPWPGGRYHAVGLARPETYFYRQVYLRCVRAFDVLSALPETDSRRIMVYGGSQGGGLSIITAALRPEVAFCAPAIPGLCRLDWTVRYGVGSWPLNQQDVPAGQTLDQMLATLSYYDAANFIGRVKCPIAGTIGWLDTITAAGGQVAAFAQANRERFTFTAAPWGRHGADGRTQQAYYGNHTLFQQGQAIPLPKTWLVPATGGER